MANYATLKAAIAAAIRENGNNEITGNLLQQQLLAMVNSLGVGYQYIGTATPVTNPGTPDQNVFYLASTAGTYTNFGGLVLADGEIAILKYNGAWSKDSTGAASLEMVNQLGQKLQGKVFQDGEISLAASANADLTGFPTNKTIAICVQPTDPSITEWNYLSLSVYAGGWQNLGQIKNRKFHYFDIPSNAVRVVLSTGSAFTAMTADVFATYDVEIPASTQIAVEGLEAEIGEELDKKLDFTKSQTLSDAQKAQALGNLGIAFDSVPTANSNNLVKSGAIKTAIDNAVAPKVNSSYTNILDRTQIVDGSGYSSSGNQFDVHDNWKGSYGALTLPWRTATKMVVSNIRATSGFTCGQKDADGNVIATAKVTDTTGQYTFTRADGAVLVYLTIKPSDATLRANYGETLLPYSNLDIDNPIAGYLGGVNERIDKVRQEMGGKTNVLYAYADGDATPDDATHFYGWKNGVCSIQRAINASNDYTKIFCKGIFNVTGPSQFILQEDGLYNVIFIPHDKVGIELIGEGSDKTVLNVTLADNSDIASYQPLAMWGNKSVVRGIGINAKNTRYCIHLDASAGRQADGFSISIIDCVLRHYENTPNGYEAPFGLGISDGMNLLTENCTLICERSGIPPLYVHDNKQFNEGFIWTIKNCHLVPTFGSASSAQSTNVNSAVQLITIQSKGSGADGYIVLDGNDYGSCKPLFINQQENINSKTNLADFSPKVYIGIRGNMAVPYGYDPRPLATGSKPGVLRITSKSAGADSKVRFDTTSSAFDIIVRGLLNTGYIDKFGVIHTDGYQYRDGVSYLHGYAMGELALDTGRICSMQKRLGDCSSTSKSLVVSVDGVSYTITFNQDYTNYSDADMLAVFTAVLGSVADVELYNWGADYFPEIEPSYGIFKNNNNYYIGKGAGVKIAGDGVRFATTDDEVDAIALDDILPNYYGRCCRKVMLSIFESDHHHISLDAYPQSDSDKYTSAFAADFGINENVPGQFIKKEGGILKFKYYGYLILDK